MGQLFGNKYLKFLAALQGRTIEHDEPCGACGYNLRGVRYGGVCPECGSPIVLGHSLRDALSDAPLREIKRIRLGIWVAMVCLPALLLAPFVAAIFPGDPVPLACGLGISAVWVGAVWLMTPPIDAPRGVRHGFGPTSPLRLAVRGAQVGWLLAYALLIAAWIAAVGSLVVMTAAAALALLIGMAGLVLLAVLLGRLADWCYDEVAGRLLEWALWGLPICILALPVTALFPGTRFFAPILGVFLVASLGCFILGLIFLGRSVTWSVHHAKRQAERDRGLRRRTDRALPPDADERASIPLAPPREQNPPIESQPRGP